MNKKLIEFFKKQAEGNKDENNFLAKAYKKFKSIPPMKRAIIINFLLNGIYVVLVVVFIIIIVSFPNAALEFMRGAVNRFSQGIKDFGESLGNFLSGYGFQSNEELQLEYEEKYYKKLYKVYNKYAYTGMDIGLHKYKVEINTTLITATLFYDRIGANLGSECEGDKCFDEEDQQEFTHDDAKFYENAISKIELLARMMMVKNELWYDCTGKVKKDIIVPKDVQELVASNDNSWASVFGIYKFPVRSFEYTIIGKENKEADFPTYTMCNMYESANGNEPDVEVILKAVAETDIYKEYLEKHEEWQQGRLSYYECLSNDEGTKDNNFCNDYKVDADSTNNTLDEYREKLKNLPSLGEFIDFDGLGRLKFKCPEGYYTGGIIDILKPVCQKDKPLDSPVYTSEWYEKGFYYYNIMHRPNGDKSFIEKYYPHLIKDDTRDEDVQKIVDGIYSYYNSYISNMMVYDNEYERGLAYPVKFEGYSTVFEDGGGLYGIMGFGEWTKWSQHIGPWAPLSMYTTTISKAGCAFVSTAILIAKAHEEKGLDVSMIQPEFNPTNYLAAYKQHGGYQTTTNIYWDLVSKVVPGFHYLGQGHSLDYARNQIRQGFYCVIHVNNRGPASGGPDNFYHYVAAAGLVGNEIYVYDPGRAHDGPLPLSGLYSWAVTTDQVICYAADAGPMTGN